MGFAYDVLGNLTQRTDSLTYGTENFTYDGLNRLLTAQVSGQTTHAVSYNNIGNILTKTRLDDNSLTNTYSYPSTGSARPHAVSSVSGKVNGVNNPTYTYDANGNLSSGGGRSIQWTVFNMVECVANGSASCAGGATTKVEYTYDADHSRITQKETAGSAVTTTTYLNGPVSSEKVVTGSIVTWTDYLFAGGNRVGARSFTVGVGTPTTKYYITDHLGSVAVVTDGTTHARRSYDAWGKSRYTNGTDDGSGSPPPTALDFGQGSPTRGFTDHEHMPSVGLVNMNARVYDPELGRFLSADHAGSIDLSRPTRGFTTGGDQSAKTQSDRCSERFGEKDASQGGSPWREDYLL